MLRRLFVFLFACATAFAQLVPPTNTNNVKIPNGVTGTTPITLDYFLKRYVFPEQWGAKADGSTNDQAAIQSALTYATSNNKVVVFQKGKTYKLTSGVTGDCDIEGAGATLDFGNDFNSTAVTLGPTSGNTVKRTLRMPDLSTTRTTSTGWTATSGIGVQFQNLTSSDVWMGKVSGFAEGIRLTNPDASGLIYNNFFLSHMQSNKVALHLKCANSGWVNSNRFYNGRVQYSGGITNGQSGSYSVWIEGQVSGHDANQNEFFGFGTEGDVNQYAIIIQGGQYNNFHGTRLEQTTPTVRFEGITGNDAVRNKIILGYATNGITISSGALGYDNWVWGPERFSMVSGGNNGGIIFSNRSGDTSPMITGYGSADKDIIGNPNSATTWLTRIGAGQTDYKASGDTTGRIRIDPINGRVYYSDGSTAFTSYLRNYNNGSGSGGVQVISGELAVGTAGSGLRIAEGSNAKMGLNTLVAGSKVVSTTAVTANSRIFVLSNSDGGTPGWLRVSARTAGTSFTVTSSSGTDTSSFAWIIIEPS